MTLASFFFGAEERDSVRGKQSGRYKLKPGVCVWDANGSAKIRGKALMKKTAVQRLKTSVRDSRARVF